METTNMEIINNARRERMRGFNSPAASYRRWTSSEYQFLIRAYMDNRDVICPVCNSIIVAGGHRRGLCCDRCGNKGESARVTTVRKVFNAGTALFSDNSV